MTDGHLMDADCVHGVVWHECTVCPQGPEEHPPFAVISEGSTQEPPRMGDRFIVEWPRTPKPGRRMVVHGTYTEREAADAALLTWIKRTDPPSRRVE